MHNSDSPSSLQLSNPIFTTPNHNSNQSEKSLLDERDDVDIHYLRSEQAKIDTILNFLLHYNSNKRKRGRPKADASQPSESNLEVPDTVNDHFKSITNINDLHPGVLLDYLKKVNNLNKKLLNSVEQLNTKYSIISEKIDSKDLRDENLGDSNQPILENPQPHSLSRNNEVTEEKPSDELSGIEIKLDALEQRSNEKILICNGTFVTNIIEDKESNNIKTELLKKIKRHIPTLSETDLENVIIFGKTKKSLKIKCSSLTTKNLILNEIRKLKLSDIYFSEFLTTYRNNLFYKLRQVKRNYSAHISAAYLRDGNVCYKITGSDRFVIVRCLQLQA